MAALRVLRRAGYQVLTAATGAAAEDPFLTRVLTQKIREVLAAGS